MPNQSFIIRRSIFVCLLGLFHLAYSQAQTKTIPVQSFEKLIVAPHVQVILEEGNEESVTLDELSVSEEKVHVEVSGKTLQIYLDGAKFTTKHNKTKENGVKRSTPIYQGTQVSAHVHYKQLKELSIRGEETITCASPLKGDQFKSFLYGEASLILQDLAVQEFRAVLYGDNRLTAHKGSAATQVLKAYGDSEIDLQHVPGLTAKITSYGDSKFKVNTKESIKIWAFGDARIDYLGDPEINKTVSVGDISIHKLQ